MNHSNHAMSSFTRGSQIFMHTFRMMIQGTKAAFLVSGVMVLGWFIFQCSSKLLLTDIYYWLYERWGTLKLGIGEIFYKPHEINIGVYDLTLNMVRHLSVIEYQKRIWYGPIGSRLMAFWDWLVSQAILESVAVFLLGVILTYVFFVIRGRHVMSKSKTRGGDLVTPAVLSHRLNKSGEASDITIGGLPIVKDSERQHILVTGTTGVGKTNFLHELIPQIRARGEMAIIVDVNGSFVGPYFDERKDLLLNPFDQRSVDWLPWADCKESYDYDALASAIMGAPSHHDPFWEESAKRIIAETLKMTQGQQDIKEVMRILTTAPLAEYGEFFAQTDVASITDNKPHSPTTSVRGTMSNKVKLLSYLQETKHPFSLKKHILDKQNDSWLFITSMPDQRKTLSPLLTFWVEIVLNGFMQRNPTEENKNIWLIMDELPAMGKIPSLKTGLAEARKYGGCLVAGAQNIHQLTEIYGRSEALNLLDQFNTRFLFRVGDKDTAQMSSKLLGRQETRETQESLSYGANTMRDGVNINTIERMKDLVLPTEVMKLKNLACYVRLAGNWPITKLSMKYQSRESKNELFIKRIEDDPQGQVEKEKSDE